MLTSSLWSDRTTAMKLMMNDLIRLMSPHRLPNKCHKHERNGQRSFKLESTATVPWHSIISFTESNVNRDSECLWLTKIICFITNNTMSTLSYKKSFQCLTLHCSAHPQGTPTLSLNRHVFTLGQQALHRKHCDIITVDLFFLRMCAHFKRQGQMAWISLCWSLTFTVVI